MLTAGSDSIDVNQFLGWMGNKMTDNYNADDLVQAFRYTLRPVVGLVLVTAVGVVSVVSVVIVIVVVVEWF